jgi:hypothetical protein
MGKILISLDDETEKKFREITIRLFGDKRGGLSIAGEQAIREWIVRNDTQIRF